MNEKTLKKIDDFERCRLVNVKKNKINLIKCLSLFFLKLFFD